MLVLLQPCIASDIGAVVKVVDTHLCGWGSIAGEGCRHSIAAYVFISI